MDQKSRAEAVAAKESQYYTGKPCRNGHLTYRYTKSGVCAGCVAQSTAAVRGALGPASGGIQHEGGFIPTRVVRAELEQVRLRAHHGDVPTLQAVVLAYAMTRWPCVTLNEVVVKGAPRDPAGGTALYTFRVPGENVEGLRVLANTLLNNHAVDLTGFRAQQARAAAAMVGADAPAVGEWLFT